MNIDIINQLNLAGAKFIQAVKVDDKIIKFFETSRGAFPYAFIKEGDNTIYETFNYKEEIQKILANKEQIIDKHNFTESYKIDYFLENIFGKGLSAGKQKMAVRRNIDCDWLEFWVNGGRGLILKDGRELFIPPLFAKTKAWEKVNAYVNS